MNDRRARKPFTGRHITAILVAFFAVVIAVNFAMARLAMTTFGGKVVENSYVASQQYNEWLRRAEAQDRLGWDHRVTVDADRHMLLSVGKDGAPLDGLRVAATLHHPLGRTASAPVRFVPAGNGALRSAEPLAKGRWRLDLVVARGADEARYRVDVR